MYQVVRVTRYSIKDDKYPNTVLCEDVYDEATATKIALGANKAYEIGQNNPIKKES